MWIPAELRALLTVCGACVFLVATRDTYRAARSTRLYFKDNGWALDLERSRVQVPDWLLSRPTDACVLPEQFKSAQAVQSIVAVHGKLPARRKWCLPDAGAARAREISKLEALLKKMRELKGAGPAVAAQHVGVDVDVFVFGEAVLLNPLLKNEQGAATWCEVGSAVSPPRRIRHYQSLEVAYETPLGGTAAQLFEGRDACVLAALLEGV